MKLAFELPPRQVEKLRAEAERLGLPPEDLARAALTDVLATPDELGPDRAPSSCTPGPRPRSRSLNDGYSARSVTAGSTPVARIAGISAAIRPTSATIVAATL